mmetsp:Transcript_49387/g.160061  ORF Transcript_49387/g.160061 Transcript_49387/m.160061 type:complete len:202 (-) Transcript_49387:176-781(-)
MATGQSTARQEAALHPCPATSPQAADALSCRRPPPAACRSRRCLRLQATGQRASIGGACGRRGRTSPQAATPRRASRCRHPPPLPGGLPAPASRRACSGAWTSARSRAASGCLSRWRVRAITTRTSRAAAVRSQAGGAGRTDIISKCGRPQSPGAAAGEVCRHKTRACDRDCVWLPSSCRHGSHTELLGSYDSAVSDGEDG